MSHASNADNRKISTDRKAALMPYAGLGFDLTPVTDRATGLHLRRAAIGPVKTLTGMVREKQLKP